MIEEYLQELAMRERHANAQRAALLDEALRDLEPRRTSHWPRLSRVISLLRLKRRTARRPTPSNGGETR